MAAGANRPQAERRPVVVVAAGRAGAAGGRPVHRYVCVGLAEGRNRAFGSARGATPPTGILDEEGTSRFLTNLRRLTEDKFKKWLGAVTVSRAEYLVKV